MAVGSGSWDSLFTRATIATTKTPPTTTTPATKFIQGREKASIY